MSLTRTRPLRPGPALPGARHLVVHPPVRPVDAALHRPGWALLIPRSDGLRPLAPSQLAPVGAECEPHVPRDSRAVRGHRRVHRRLERPQALGRANGTRDRVPEEGGPQPAALASYIHGEPGQQDVANGRGAAQRTYYRPSRQGCSRRRRAPPRAAHLAGEGLAAVEPADDQRPEIG